MQLDMFQQVMLNSTSLDDVLHYSLQDQPALHTNRIHAAAAAHTAAATAAAVQSVEAAKRDFEDSAGGAVSNWAAWALRADYKNCCERL